VRSIAPLLEHKATDPAVVAVDVGARFAVSVLSGHEGGANTLAYRVAAAIGATPVISTTTEALKTLVVGIGCRRGTSAETIIRTIDRTLEEVGRKPEEIRLIASADIKRKEKGILKAAEHFSAGTFFVPSETIRAFAGAFEESDFVKAKVNLPAVAQPAAMLAALRPKLLLPRKKWSGITIAIVEENCSLWE
jgi:cobalt-precorrin 5A hydrolase